MTLRRMIVLYIRMGSGADLTPECSEPSDEFTSGPAATLPAGEDVVGD